VDLVPTRSVSEANSFDSSLTLRVSKEIHRQKHSINSPLAAGNLPEKTGGQRLAAYKQIGIQTDSSLTRYVRAGQGPATSVLRSVL